MEIKNFKIRQIEEPPQHLQRTPLSKTKTWEVANGIIEMGGIHYNREKKSILHQIVDQYYNGRFRAKVKRDILVEKDRGEQDEAIMAKLKLSKQDYKEFLHEIEKDGNRNAAFYDRAQYKDKIRMNSLYGACGNKWFHLYDLDNAINITLSGQDLIRFMSNGINQYFKEEFHKDTRFFDEINEDNKILDDVVVLIDTDSVLGDSKLNTSKGTISIEDLFNKSTKRTYIADRAYAEFNGEYVEGFNKETKNIEMGELVHIVKHKVNKEMFEIEIQGKKVVVTEDEGIIVERSGDIISVTPKEIKQDDKLIVKDD